MKLTKTQIKEMLPEDLKIVTAGARTAVGSTQDTYSKTSTMKAMTETEVDVEYEAFDPGRFS
jgi:hypothetical protein